MGHQQWSGFLPTARWTASREQRATGQPSLPHLTSLLNPTLYLGVETRQHEAHACGIGHALGRSNAGPSYADMIERATDDGGTSRTKPRLVRKIDQVWKASVGRPTLGCM
jgi:hypothetical protein